MIWRTARRTFDLAHRGIIMGIINVTPDSFSDGGSFRGPEDAVAHGLRLADEGAQILDIGGESTRPGAATVSAEEELRRVIPVIEQLARRTSAAISVDTSKADVARAALDAGAEIINDVTALQGDPAMSTLTADRRAGVVLMHMRGNPRTMQEDPRYEDVTGEVRNYLRARIAAARDAGIAGECIAIDPGVCFGKTVEQNMQLIKDLGVFAALERPVILGASRKSFLATAAGCANIKNRDIPTAVLTALGYRLGARIFRVHAVLPNMQALKLAEAVAAG